MGSSSVGGCYLEPDVMRRREVSRLKVFCGKEAVELGQCFRHGARIKNDSHVFGLRGWWVVVLLIQMAEERDLLI